MDGLELSLLLCMCSPRVDRWLAMSPGFWFFMRRAGLIVNEAVWVERWLGSPRYYRYLNTCSGDQELALALYDWNVELGAAMMRDVSHFEIALRNSYDAAFSEYWTGNDHWLLDTASPVRAEIVRKRKNVNEHTQKSIDAAIAKTRRRGTGEVLPGRVIAELTFGFWASLTDRSREKTIWVPFIHHAFPEGTDRNRVDGQIGRINVIRNRVAHHEPLFDPSTPEYEIPRVVDDIQCLLKAMIPEVANHVVERSTVVEIFCSRPDKH